MAQLLFASRASLGSGTRLHALTVVNLHGIKTRPNEYTADARAPCGSVYQDPLGPDASSIPTFPSERNSSPTVSDVGTRARLYLCAPDGGEGYHSR